MIPRVADGLTKARGLSESLFMRVLSPRMEPPVLRDEGSIAYETWTKTANENCETIALVAYVRAQLLDQRRLSGTGRAAEADTQRPRSGQVVLLLR